MPQILAERPSPDTALDGTASRRTVTVNLAESPLTWLAARRLISDRQAAAGEAVRRDFETAQLGPRVTMRWRGVMPAQPARFRTQVSPRAAGLRQIEHGDVDEMHGTGSGRLTAPASRKP